jgi:hypothetical protein
LEHDGTELAGESSAKLNLPAAVPSPWGEGQGEGGAETDFLMRRFYCKCLLHARAVFGNKHFGEDFLLIIFHFRLLVSYFVLNAKICLLASLQNSAESL